ncbi:hypothetical protein PC123_g19680 [Phytophthora cactorum]|nr:hypothetical protein PC120_g12946 [Phytophthora cactorum]KAG4044903.1 hypothetical protein PC123_g19680 [Phytophthora cactorum]
MKLFTAPKENKRTWSDNNMYLVAISEACGGGPDFLALNNIVQNEYLHQAEELANFAKALELEPLRHMNLGKEIVAAVMSDAIRRHGAVTSAIRWYICEQFIRVVVEATRKNLTCHLPCVPYHSTWYAISSRRWQRARSAKQTHEIVSDVIMAALNEESNVSVVLFRRVPWPSFTSVWGTSAMMQQGAWREIQALASNALIPYALAVLLVRKESRQKKTIEEGQWRPLSDQ